MNEISDESVGEPFRMVTCSPTLFRLPSRRWLRIFNPTHPPIVFIHKSYAAAPKMRSTGQYQSVLDFCYLCRIIDGSALYSIDAIEIFGFKIRRPQGCVGSTPSSCIYFCSAKMNATLSEVEGPAPSQIYQYCSNKSNDQP